MTGQEIHNFVNQVENLWFENLVARRYLEDKCDISDPDEFLKNEVKKIPKDSLLYRLFAPVRQAIGHGLQDTEYFERLHKAILELSKRLKD